MPHTLSYPLFPTREATLGSYGQSILVIPEYGATQYAFIRGEEHFLGIALNPEVKTNDQNNICRTGDAGP